MERLFTPNNANALFEALMWAKAAKNAGCRNVKCTFLGMGCFRVSAL
jgi:hypothetical protein